MPWMTELPSLTLQRAVERRMKAGYAEYFFHLTSAALLFFFLLCLRPNYCHDGAFLLLLLLFCYHVSFFSLSLSISLSLPPFPFPHFHPCFPSGFILLPIKNMDSQTRKRTCLVTRSSTNLTPSLPLGTYNNKPTQQNSCLCWMLHFSSLKPSSVAGI